MRPAPLPSLLLFTDPFRTPDPLGSVERLPRASGVIFRAFGDPEAVSVGRALRRACSRSGHVLLVGADQGLAAAIGADGVHLPERLAGRLPGLRARRPCWLVTAAAHSVLGARRAGVAGADAVIVSAVFPSDSPSAGAPLGALRLARIVRLTPAPVYALGGVDASTVRRLMGTGVAGVAAVAALA